MTGPRVEPMSGPLSFEQFAAAQSAPASAMLSGDPAKQTTNALGRPLTFDEFQQAQGKTVSQLQSWKIPALPMPTFQRDVTKTPADPTTKGKKIETPIVGALMRQLVDPALEHPVQGAALASLLVPGVAPILAAAAPLATLAGGTFLGGSAAAQIAQYGWQKYLEQDLSPDAKKEFQQDPDRVSGEAAAVQAAMLGLAPLIHVGSRATDVSGGMMEAGAQGVKETNFAPRFSEGFADVNARAKFAAQLESGAQNVPDGGYVPPLKGLEPTSVETKAPRGVKPVEGLEVAPSAKAGRVKAIATETPMQSVESLREADAARVKEEAMRPRKRQPADAGIDLTKFNVDEGIHSRLLNTKDGADIGTLGSYIADPKIRALYADVLDTPVIKLSEPPGGAPEGTDFKGARGTYKGQDAIFIAAQPAKEFIPTLLEEGAHQLRVARGRADAPQTLDGNFHYEKYQSLPAEQSAERMVKHALSLAQNRPAPAPFFETPQGAETLGAMAARHGVPEEANPYHPDSPLGPEWQAGHDNAKQSYPLYPEGFSMGGALQDNRIPGASEIPKTARGTNVVEGLQTNEQPAGATSEAAQLAAALKPRRPLTPVEGTGPTRTRGLAQGVQDKALANQLDLTVGQLPEYQQVSMADQASRAADLIANDPDLARRVATGAAPAPHGLLPESVFVAVEQKAIAEGDVATLRDLATGKLTSDATTMGQRIRALGERAPDSPVKAMKDVVDARSGGEKNAAKVAKASEAELATIRAAIDNTPIEPSAWTSFVDSLKC